MDQYPQWRTNTFANSKTTLSTSASFVPTTTSSVISTQPTGSLKLSTDPAGPTATLTKSLSSALPSITVTAMDNPTSTTGISSQTSSAPASKATTSSPTTTGGSGATAFGPAQIIGTSVGATAGIALIAAIGILLMRKRRRTWPRDAPTTRHVGCHPPSGIQSVGGENADFQGVCASPAYGAVPPGVSELDGGGHRHAQLGAVSRNF